MDIEPDIEFLVHRCVCQFAFHIDESERFPPSRGPFLRLCPNRQPAITCDRHTALFKTARPHPKRFRSHKV